MKNRRILPFFAVFLFFNFAANFAHPVTPALIVERNLDSSMFGVALAAMMTTNFLFSPFWGRLGDYIPTKRILLITGLGYSLGQFFFMRANTEISMILGRMFAGAFTGGAYTTFYNYIINTSESDSQRDGNLVLFATLTSVSSAIGYFIGGMMGVISTTVPLVMQVVTLASCAVLFQLACVDDTPFKPKPERALSVGDVNPFRAFVTARKFMTPMLALIFGIVAISAIGQNSYEQCFNFYIKDQFGMSSAYNGTFKALIAIVTLILNSTVCVTLQRKTDINKTFLYVIAACACLISTILIFHNQILFVAIYILYSGVNVIRLPLLQSMIARRSNAHSRNTLMGFNQSMTSLGGIFGALFAGLIYKQGPMLPFLLAFAAYVAAALIGVIYVNRYKKEK